MIVGSKFPAAACGRSTNKPAPNNFFKNETKHEKERKKQGAREKYRGKGIYLKFEKKKPLTKYG